MFGEAVRTLAPPGTEDDVLMDESGSGQLDDLEAARRYLDEDDALQVRIENWDIYGVLYEEFFRRFRR